MKYAVQQHYERYEWTRLASIREQMLKHKTYNKEQMMDDFEQNAKKGDKYVWSFVMKPVDDKK